MKFVLYAIFKAVGEPITHVKCAKGDAVVETNIPWIPLQFIDVTPGIARLAWVKWCLRFRRTLEDAAYLDYPQEISLLVNPKKLRRFMGELADHDARVHERFHKYHESNLELLDRIVADCKKDAAGGVEADGIVGKINDQRYFGEDTVHGEGYKIPAEFTAFYSRLVQMEAPELCGIFQVRPCLADDLLMPDGRSWRSFAEDHQDCIRWSKPKEVEKVADEWEYV